MYPKSLLARHQFYLWREECNKIVNKNSPMAAFIHLCKSIFRLHQILSRNNALGPSQSETKDFGSI